MPLPQPPPTPRGTNGAASDQPLPLPPPDRRLRQRLGDGAKPCYRHPNRTGGRQCTRCGKYACADCLSQAAVGSHCVDCAKAARPDLRTRARYWQASKPAIVTYTLIGINVAVFVGLGLWYGLPEMLSRSGGDAHLKFALSDFFLDGRRGTYRLSSGVESTNGNEWYRFVTSGFLHYGILHLALNMYALFILGNQMEPSIGRARFLAIYAASLLGGSAGVLIFDQVFDQGGLTAGASGAVFGLFGAFAAGLRQRGVNPFATHIGRILLFNLVITFLVVGISVGGHLGGLAAGAICGYVTMAPAHKQYSTWLRWATPAAVGLVAIVISVLLVRVV